MHDLQMVQISPRSAPITEVVQSAIDGTDQPLRIAFLAGRHSLAGLRLRSDITLHFEPGAELHFQPDYDAYRQTTGRLLRPSRVTGG